MQKERKMWKNMKNQRERCVKEQKDQKIHINYKVCQKATTTATPQSIIWTCCCLAAPLLKRHNRLLKSYYVKKQECWQKHKKQDKSSMIFLKKSFLDPPLYTRKLICHIVYPHWNIRQIDWGCCRQIDWKFRFATLTSAQLGPLLEKRGGGETFICHKN